MWSVLSKAGTVGHTVLTATERYFEPAADVILRVPSLVLLDYLWRFEVDKTLLWGAAQVDDKFGVFNTIIVISLLLQAAAVLLLPLEYVVRLYMHYISAAVLVLANQFSFYHVSSEAALPAAPGLTAYFRLVPVWQIWAGAGGGAAVGADAAAAAAQVEFLRRQMAAIAVHLTAAVTVIVLLDVEDTRRRVSLLANALPVVALMASMASGSELLLLHNCACAVTIINCLTWLLGCAPACLAYYQQLYLKYYFHATQVYGAAGTLRQLIATLFVPRLQLAYWLCLVLTQGYYFAYVPESVPSVRGEWYIVLLSAVASATASPISLAGFCAAVAYGSWWAVRALAWLLRVRPAEHSGWVEAATALVLACYVDLIHLAVPARLAVMAVLLFVALTSTAQVAYDVAEAAVLSLSASGSRRVGRHARVVLVCLLLAALPVWLTVLLCRLFERDLWILLVTSSALTLAVQALGLLTVYAVFLYDALRREPWRHLDDVVYCTRAAAGAAQTLVALLVVAAGVWETSRGGGSWGNAAVLLAHCYFHIWRRLRDGWGQLALRRTVARTAAALPEASPELLRRYGDVCAICYCAMSEARRLPCRHLFHAACLRRWLFVQVKCPLCQAEIVEAEKPPQEPAPAQEQTQAAADEAAPAEGAEKPTVETTEAAAEVTGGRPGPVAAGDAAASLADVPYCPLNCPRVPMLEGPRPAAGAAGCPVGAVRRATETSRRSPAAGEGH
ncbi:RING finger protein 145-like [Amphibalanus amphitrite]|uniref:RING finger protein 145-like n=1 Tax=Amphibalanus amphitrite TaxID=1232801 RepID=UPI001C92A6D8|nr:RING finger protein 145-like [Amphibalanus amphitrite]XP_043221887.1 RING finger protein 145-like [Amphibalanus amphitrite]